MGTNQEISINELSELFIRLTNSKSKIVKLPYDVAYRLEIEDMV